MAKRIISIDPGLRNLGWVMMQDRQVLRYGNDALNYGAKPNNANINSAVVEWMRMRQDLFTSCDVVLIELQFMNTNSTYNRGTFWPLTVMHKIAAVAEWIKPNSVHLVHAGSVKKHFNITGTYNERKAEVVNRFGQHLPDRTADDRWHDACDAMINAWYWLEKQTGERPKTPEPESPSLTIEALRQLAPLQPKTKKAKRAVSKKQVKKRS